MRPSRSPAPGTRLLLGLALLMACGCQAGTGPIARWRMATDPLMKDPSKGEMSDDRGLMARWLAPGSAKGSGVKPPPPTTIVEGSDGWSPGKPEPPDPVVEAEFKAAEQLYQRGKLAEAEEAFARIARVRKETWPGERAQFYLAETQYQRGRLVAANDSYVKLVTTYPGTRFLEKSVDREYTIGLKWLATHEGSGKPEDRLPASARTTGGLPLVDTGGFALAALEHVRQHDPTGPLADDALMRIADYHYNIADYDTAAEYYDQLIQNDPKSPFLQRAHMASIDAKMKAYIGPEYDGSGLEQAKATIKQTMAAFPERQVTTGDELYHKLDLIADQKAERAFTTAAYYKSAGAIDSAEYYYGMVPKRWPKSPWAAKAKTELAQLAKAPRKTILPSKIMSRPGSNDPFAGSMNGMGANMGGMGGMGSGAGGGGGMGGGMPNN